MTVQELIECMEEVEDLDVVCITRKGQYCSIYEDGDINYIDYRDLYKQVIKYTYGTRKVKERDIRCLEIYC